MPALSKAALKALWIARFQPTSADFSNLIDSWTDYSVAFESVRNQVSAGATGVANFTSTASASFLAVGATGTALLSAATTTAAQTAIGAGTVGARVFSAATTAAAITGMGGGTVGGDVFQATQANSGAAIFGSINNMGTTAGTVTLNLNTALNHRMVLSGAVTFNAPTGALPGASGVIECIQNASGNQAATFTNSWIWEGGSFPGLSTTASARDMVAYYVSETSVIYARIGTGYA